MVVNLHYTFWKNSLPSPSKQQREMSKFHVFFREGERMTANLFFFFGYFDVVHYNLVPGKFSTIFQVEQIGIIMRKSYKNEKLHFEITFSSPSSSPLLKALYCEGLVWVIIFPERVGGLPLNAMKQ